MQSVILFIGIGTCLAAAAGAEDEVNYADHVRPIFAQHCFACHNADKTSGGLNLSTYHGALAGGSGGEVLAPGDPSSSRLLSLITHADEPKMPPESPRLDDGSIAAVRRWIEQGLRETAASAAKRAEKPAVDLSLGAVPTQRPDGPPIMPVSMPLGPVVATQRPGAITALAAHPWSPLVAVGGQKQVLLYDSRHLELLGVLPFDDFPHHVGFTRGGGLLFAAGGRGARAGYIRLWRVETGEPVATVGDEVDSVLAADIHPDQTRVALGGPSRKVRIHATDGALLHTIDKHTDWVLALAYSPDGILLATGDRAGNLHVWESDSFGLLHTLGGHDSAITSMDWRADSNVLATAGEDGTVRLWEMHRGGKVKQWKAHAGGTLSVRFTGDGRLVTAGRDRQARLWAQDGAAIRAFEAFEDIATAAVFDDETGRVIAGDWAGRLRVFGGEDGAAVGVLSANPPPIAESLAAARQRLDAATGERAEAAESHGHRVAAAQEAAAQLAAARQRLQEADALVASRAEVVANAATAKTAKAAEIERTGTERSEKEAALEQSIAQIAGREAQVATHAEQLGEVNVEVEAARASLDSHRAAAAAAEARAAAAPEDAGLAGAAGRARALADEAAAQVEQLDQRVSRSGAAIEAVKAPLAEATAAKTAAATALAAVEQRLAALGGEANELARVLAEAEAAGRDAAAARDRIGPRVAERQGAAEAAGGERDEAAQRLRLAEAELSESGRVHAKWKWAALGVEIAQVERQRRERAAQIAPVQENAEQAAAAAAAAERRLAKTEKELADLPALIGSRVAAVAGAEQALAKAGEHVKICEQALEGSRRRAADFEPGVGRLAAQVEASPGETIGQALAAAQEALRLLESDRDKAAAALKDAGLGVEDAAFDLEAARDGLAAAEAQRATLPPRIEVIRGEVEADRKAAAAARSAYESARRPLVELEGRLDEMRAQHAALHEQARRRPEGE